MSDIKTFQQQIFQARETASTTNNDYLNAKEALLKNKAEQEKLHRIYDARNEKHKKKSRELTEEQSTLIEKLDSLKGDHTKQKDKISSAIGLLDQLGDPKQLAAKLDDRNPILLFPLRVETRFKKTGSGSTEKNELWLRIYPDDCVVETFTEIFSEGELKNIKSFWIAMWISGGVEEAERSAWKALVNVHGAGRSAWLYENYKPLNLGDNPGKTDLNLVFIKDVSLSQSEIDEAALYWKNFWLAGEDNQKREQAYTVLKSATSAGKADYIIHSIIPANINDPVPAGKLRKDMLVNAAAISFPPDSSVTTSASNWTQAPTVRALPEKFLILGFNNGKEELTFTTNLVSDELHVGPDPSLPDSDQMKHEAGKLEINKELKWLTDFDEAVTRGMGARIPITQQQAATGFNKLLVLGIRYSTDGKKTSQLAEKLFKNHYYSSNGLSILPQGTPTNNTEQQNSGYNSLDDSDISYDIVFKNKEAFELKSDDTEKADGQWLAEALGISADFLRKIPNSAGSDQKETRAMNIALWPATMGYFLEEMMFPALNKFDINATRNFFNHYVSGRGSLPAIRVGKQPYGILPATVFSKLTFESGQNTSPDLRLRNDISVNMPEYLNRLHQFLLKIDAQWDLMAKEVAYIGKPGNPHQQLLDIIGLHASSIEFYQRYAESFQQLFNELVLKFGSVLGGLLAAFHNLAKRNVLTNSGIATTENIPLLDKYFLENANFLKGDIIDDQPLSETKPVRAYTTDKKNYLTWLIESSLDRIRKEDFGGEVKPNSLLYLWLRHALMLSYWDGGLKLYENAEIIEPGSSRLEPDFIHVSDSKISESKWNLLYQSPVAITSDDNVSVAQFISKQEMITSLPELFELNEIKNALKLLEKTPTARLERLFAEHMDSCTYRLDAWKNALINFRLQEMRQQIITAPNPGEKTNDLYIGAYGYLENVKSENKILTPISLTPELSKIFQKQGAAAPVRDNKNSGFIHAPSIAQASTAAILKSAYISQADPTSAETYSINLSSERVRKTNSILEGVRNGQSLAALLGYQFERGLHDKHNLAEVDKFIYPLRKVCPLVADKMKETQTDSSASIETIEARNVLDGVKLVNQIKNSNNNMYPFGFTGLPAANSTESQAINSEVQNLLDTYDAISDVMLSETVYQVVQGNFERAAANAEVMAKGGYPAEIEVVKTPRSGKSLTHRFALHFDAGVNPVSSPVTGLVMSPRAKAEAPVNDWLTKVLPNPDKVVCKVVVKSHIDGTESEIILSQKIIGLQAIDAIYAAGFDSEQSMTELDDRIWQLLIYDHSLHPLDSFRIKYTSPPGMGKYSFFETGALIRSLRKVLLKSTFVKPEDLALTQEGIAGSGNFDIEDLKFRIDGARNSLIGFVADLQSLQTNVIDDIDTLVKKISKKLILLSYYGLPQTGSGYLHNEIKTIFLKLHNKLSTLVSRWEEKQNRYAELDILYAAAVTNADRQDILIKMESTISTELTIPIPVDYRATVETKKTNFNTLHSKFKAHLKTTVSKLSEFIAAIKIDTSGIINFDPVPLDTEAEKSDLSPEDKAIALFRQSIQNKLLILISDIQARSTKVTQLFSASDDKASLYDKISLLLQAGRLVLGEELLLLPKFKYSETQGDEITNALTPANITQLLKYQTDTMKNRFPVDDWVYSLGRIKEKIFHWENIVFLSEAFNTIQLNLKPIQLPFQTNDTWVALEFPKDYKLESERLLYTVNLEMPFDKSVWQCGLRIEDWTEVIPAREETSGISFHYDQPNTEPPQTMLLMVPPVFSGKWNWDDITGGILETFEMAKKRAVEPEHLDKSIYGQFLPATIMAVTLYQISISTNLAVNNNIYLNLTVNN